MATSVCPISVFLKSALCEGWAIIGRYDLWSAILNDVLNFKFQSIISMHLHCISEYLTVHGALTCFWFSFILDYINKLSWVRYFPCIFVYLIEPCWLTLVLVFCSSYFMAIICRKARIFPCNMLTSKGKQIELIFLQCSTLFWSIVAHYSLCTILSK